MIRYLVKEYLESIDPQPLFGVKKKEILELLKSDRTQREIAEIVGCHEQYVQIINTQQKLYNGQRRKKPFTMINGGLK